MHFFADTDASDVLIQFILEFGALLIVVIPILLQGHNHKKNIRAIDRKLTTNHGKQASEYLEMIADVHSDLQDVKADVRDVKAEQRDAKAEHAALRKELTDHTASDSTNFAAIMEELKGQS